MIIADRIQSKLTAGLAPSRLEIADDSRLHAGHAGHDPRGESHFRVLIVAAAFAGKSRVERQRLVYGLLAEELGSRVHALQLTTLAPDEPGAAAP